MKKKIIVISLSLIILCALVISVYQINKAPVQENYIKNENTNLVLESSKDTKDTKDTTDLEDTASIDDSTVNKQNTEYESFTEFPYNYLEYCDDQTYGFIQNSYSDIIFFNDFSKGDISLYHEYIPKFLDLVTNKVKFADKQNEMELFLYEYGYFGYSEKNEFDPKECSYYFFDMNGDGAPECCITDNVNYIYIFQYMPDLNKYELWKSLDATWYTISGSGNVMWNHEGTKHAFYILDKNGGESMKVFFFEREDFNKVINSEEIVYMLSLPGFENGDGQIEIDEKIKNNGYYDKGQSVYYFRVTEEQYYESTKGYFEAAEKAKENIEGVKYTFEELFDA